ncbi:MAG: RNA methyltransferase, partial [Gammaproteobacteria bacterium]|nr:RNA methyltransferase [Gammaproteobacteria bacterium]
RTPERNNTAACFQTLRAQGYKLIATSPHPGSITLPEITLDGKLAFLFGNEKEGLTEYALDNADAHLRLPMYGFTESYNITVSVAMVLAYIVDKLRNADVDWRLPEDEQQSLLLEWCRVELRRSDLLEKRYFAERAQKSS